MSINKLRISSPLEAGQSVLDSSLPQHIISALEYVSSRLMRKRLHLSLIIVRKDIGFDQTSPKLPPSSTDSIVTPSSSVSRSSSNPSPQSLSRTKWPSLPSSPKQFIEPSSPRSGFSSPTSSISSSSSWSEPNTPTTPRPNEYNISLMHAHTLTPRAEKYLRHYIHKASKLYPISSDWLSSSSLSTDITCPLTNDLIRRSLAQNNVVFSSEGLTLLALDQVYTFKATLRTYSCSQLPSDMSIAVNELRRLVLARQRKSLGKGYLMRAYDHLSISSAALMAVNEAYKSAYGGPYRCAGIELDNEDRRSPPPLKTSFARSEVISSSDAGNQGLLSVCGMEGKAAKTPNDFEDITPVTKGEWLCLMVGEGWKMGKMAPVVTC